MHRLSSLIALLAWPLLAMAQSPHGEAFRIDCAQCHTPNGWDVALEQVTFDHDTTKFELRGQHEVIDCRMCHISMVFTEAATDCASCHQDVHQNTLGDDCARCHKSDSWLVNTITEIHEQIAFPLLGAHSVASCFDCHQAENDLRFDILGTDCISCHQDEYAATTDPPHAPAGFSTNCIDCHSIEAFEWSSSGFNHNFFPLEKGHAINDCAACHTTEDYSLTSSDCASCHADDFQAAANPDHQTAGFSMQCAECHTTEPGWSPADFREHDELYFPIYSGEHAGEWDNCAICHTDQGNYAVFSCLECHEHNRADMDDEHSDVNGYSYSSRACLACHSDGSTDGVFDHNRTNFPLTGAHLQTECLSCHSTGFTGTSSFCADCHTPEFNAAINPDHNALGLSNNCASCHTTEPEWNPAQFPDHDNFYALNGAHAIIANDCAACHQGDYNSTPNTCVGCHQQEYDQTTNPSHTALQFSTDCASCHSEDAWSPSTYDHDAQYFPIYSGAHDGEWNTCTQCHTNPADYSQFSCIECHTSDPTADQHVGVGGYVHNNDACLACHPTGEAGDGFNHDETNFPLTGAHLQAECLSCHANGFEGTSTVCADCHGADFAGTTNPDHSALGLSMDCAFCHTTEPEWNPAQFPDHDAFYALNGAHAIIANDCAACHQGDYNNTTNTCVGCHQQEYDQTTNPSHSAAQFSTDCASCHTEDDWSPSTYDHDAMYFPIYSGAHEGEWNTCTQCHTNPADYSQFSCIECHTADPTANEHVGVSGYVHNSDACLACHPTGDGGDGFNHDETAFPLTGAHAQTECLSCHANGFEGTSTVCADCHGDDFIGTTNPDHGALGLSMDCASCHTTEPEWNPAQFPEHNTFYMLNGAHAAIANDCATCHQGDYNNTPNTCVGCHQQDYDQTTAPSHMAAQFSTDCATCHSEESWVPSTFDHDAMYFPIYSGAHDGEWSTCAQCHTNPADYSEFSCIECHTAGETGDQHEGVNGYIFNSDACLACHPTGEGDVGFNHDETSFPLTGVHAVTTCLECHSTGYAGTSTACVDCHTPDFNNTTNPNHIALGLPTDCASCHTTEPDWAPAQFPEHNAFYALTGAHALISNDCASCHQGDYNNTPNTCVGCHLDDYNATTDPDHVASQFSTDCASCHTESSWSPSTFDHDASAFPLTGAHITASCVDCHADGYTGTSTVCADCHTDDYNASTNPDHVALALPTDCASCHTTEPDWMPALFPDHNVYFMLNGAHALISNDCASCHNGNYTGTPNTCVGCHLADYNATVNPDHTASQFSTDCASCHTENEWVPSTFDHDASAFPLTGAHVTTSCLDCHTNGYAGTPTECSACHTPDYNSASNPNHVALVLPMDCALCHTTEPEWSPALFPDHDAYYLLSGAHAFISNDCVSCHNGNYINTPNTCVGCHLDAFNATTNPDHVASQFSTDCASCHTEVTWVPSTFDHDASAFPLTGAHVVVACIDCHTNGYSGTPTQCENCHTPEYNATTNPNHMVLALPLDCAGCHTTEPEWNPALFPDHDTYYVLNGAHALISNDCAACHNGDYNNTPNTCIGCHQSDFNATTDPDHQAAMFPDDCLLCHTETSWLPSTFDHDGMYFPIYSGRHDGEWSQCSDCHTDPGNYVVFSCLGCHTQPETDPPHVGIPGYVYNSAACYSCHPDGED